MKLNTLEEKLEFLRHTIENLVIQTKESNKWSISGNGPNYTYGFYRNCNDLNELLTWACVEVNDHSDLGIKSRIESFKNKRFDNKLNAIF